MHSAAYHPSVFSLLSHRNASENGNLDRKGFPSIRPYESNWNLFLARLISSEALIPPWKACLRYMSKVENESLWWSFHIIGVWAFMKRRLGLISSSILCWSVDILFFYTISYQKGCSHLRFCVPGFISNIMSIISRGFYEVRASLITLQARIF